MKQVEVTKRVAQVLRHDPEASIERIGRYLSICGDRPPRRQIEKALSQLENRDLFKQDLCRILAIPEGEAEIILANVAVRLENLA